MVAMSADACRLSAPPLPRRVVDFYLYLPLKQMYKVVTGAKRCAFELCRCECQL